MTIKISQAELDVLDDHSIALRDGSGYIGELAVYHELHCIVSFYIPGSLRLLWKRELTESL